MYDDVRCVDCSCFVCKVRSVNRQCWGFSFHSHVLNIYFSCDASHSNKYAEFTFVNLCEIQILILQPGQILRWFVFIPKMFTTWKKPGTYPISQIFAFKSIRILCDSYTLATDGMTFLLLLFIFTKMNENLFGFLYRFSFIFIMFQLNSLVLMCSADRLQMFIYFMQILVLPRTNYLY